jgi:hypothetical protein
MSKEEQNLTDAQILRMKAEEQLKKMQKKMDKPVLETDLKKLLHELQVHQIELEMQILSQWARTAGNGWKIYLLEVLQKKFCIKLQYRFS